VSLQRVEQWLSEAEACRIFPHFLLSQISFKFESGNVQYSTILAGNSKDDALTSKTGKIGEQGSTTTQPQTS